MQEIVRTTARSLRKSYWNVREKLSSIDFDGDFYVSAYGDVGEAVAKGHCTPFQHYWQHGRSEGRYPKFVASDPLLLAAALAPPSTPIVFMEFTTRCNLRCVYCAVSQPSYTGIDLPLENLDNFIYQMKVRGVQLVTINGFGESTIVKDWNAYADRLLDAGFRLNITTNFAKRYSEAEIATLSRFETILVSLDTVRGELLAQLRRGARVDHILANIKAVVDHAKARNRHPDIAISCVMSDVAAPFVEETVRELLALGVTTFRFGDLSEWTPIPGAIRTRHISEIDPQALPAARLAFRNAVRLIDEAGAKRFIDAPLESFLLHPNEQSIIVADRSAAPGEKSIHATKVEAKQTRDCLDPWNTAFVQSDGNVRPCCFFEEPLGSIQNGTLSEIVNNENFKQLRKELLSGELRPNCRTCASRTTIDRDAFETKVRRYVSSEKDRVAKLDIVSG